jgi:hypothetical protein
LGGGGVSAIEIGSRFGRWIVEASDTPSSTGERRWNCRCACGNTGTVAASNLRRGISRSCGCLMREAVGARNRKHGGRGTREYNAWQAMIQRCGNANHVAFKNYGGRGIVVCNQWISSFEAFIAHVGARPSALHSLDRIDNDRGYEPGNVRWATSSEQAKNRRAAKRNNGRFA